MNIDDAMQAIVQTQQRLVITDPEPRSIGAAYAFTQDPGETLIDVLPAFTNTWTLVDCRPGSGFVWASYSVNMRLHVGTAGADRTFVARQAMRWMHAITRAFQTAEQPPALGVGGLKLIGEFDGTTRATVDVCRLRGNVPSIGIFGDENAPVRTVGLDLFLDLEMTDALT